MCSCLLRPRTSLRILVLLLALNLLGLFVFHRASSVFFSTSWWNAWFPIYLFWFALAVIGISRSRRPQGDK